MNRFLTFEQLESKYNNYEQRAIYNESVNYNCNDAITVFLSHRHSEDIRLINQVRGFFVSQGANLYIDWLDKDMPKVTSSETADKFKIKIKKSSKFVILATPKSIESIWMPWEIGLADQMKGLSNIAILPIVYENKTWDKREYYQLYNRIENIDNRWLVLKPEYLSVGEELEGYCHEYDDYVCTDSMGKLLRPNYISVQFGKILKSNGFRHIRYHDLRHTCASLLLKNGIPMKAIQEWLGHSTFEVTIPVPNSNIKLKQYLPAIILISKKIFSRPYARNLHHFFRRQHHIMNNQYKEQRKTLGRKAE